MFSTNEMILINTNIMEETNYNLRQQLYSREKVNNYQIKQILENIVGFSKKNTSLFQKYEDDFYLNYFDRNSISKMQKKLQNTQKQLSIQEFVKIFLENIAHSQHQTLYLTISLIKFFKRIKEDTKNQNGVKFVDFTNYLCEKISEDDPDLVLPMKKIPNQKMVPDVSRIRQIDLEPPLIFDKTNDPMPKISKQKKKKDKQLDQKKPIAKFVYSKKLKRILTLGRLCSSICLYNQHLKVKNKIAPSHSKNTDIAILSFAFSEQYQRLGCIVNNIGITFWQAADNFKTQKIFAKSQGQKIYYLPLFDQWITTDKSTIYFWDLKQEKVENTVKRRDSVYINDISQVNHLRSLCVAYTLSNQQKCVIVYQKKQKQFFKQIARLDLSNSGCHTIHFNKFTQTLIPLGYKSTVSVYQINKQTYDINIVSQLKGHTSIISCITHVQDTSLILTGDDIGEVRIWQLNYMRCTQVIRIAKWLGQMSCIDSYLVYSDIRLNIMHMDQISLKVKEPSYVIYKFYDAESRKLWLITRKDIRIMDIDDGKVQKIYVVCGDEQQISSANKLSNAVLLGTSKGQIFSYGFNGVRKLKLSEHQNQVSQIVIDPQNKFFISASIDSNIYIWPEKSAEQGPKKALMNNFEGKSINILQLSQKYNTLLTGSFEEERLCLWDYQTLKICSVINFRGHPTGVHLSKEYPLIILGINTQILYFIKYVRKQMKFEFQLLGVIGNRAKTSNKRKTYAHNRPSFNKKVWLQQQKPQETSNIQQQIFPVSIIIPIFSGSRKQIIAIGKRNVLCIDVSLFLNGAFSQQQIEQIKKGGNIQRPIRQNFTNQIQKNQYQVFNLQQQQELMAIRAPQIIWKKFIHKQLITHAQVVNLKRKYLCTSSIDGYMKMTDVVNGQVSCSININYPLPIQWKIQICQQQQLKKQIYQAIITIDSILKQYGPQLTLYNYYMIDCSKFLNKMLNGNYCSQQNNQNKPVKLLRDQFSLEDIKKITPKITSLQALQAYKRVKIIKQNRNRKQLSTSVVNTSKEKQKSSVQKMKEQYDSISDYFASHRFPKLQQINNKTFDVSTERSNNLQPLQVTLKKILRTCEPATDPIKHKKDITRYRSKQNTQIKRILGQVEQKKFNFVQKEPINCILKNLNQKLMSYKIGYNSKRLKNEA